jgi:hypothetical protein
MTSSAFIAAAAIAFWSSMIASNRDELGARLATSLIIQPAAGRLTAHSREAFVTNFAG